jgi:hypothetical protein
MNDRIKEHVFNQREISPYHMEGIVLYLHHKKGMFHTWFQKFIEQSQ